MHNLVKYLQVSLLVTIISVSLYSQESNDSIQGSYTHIPNTLSTHPLGLFFTRIHYPFRTQATNKWSVNLSISNGNVWLPLVNSYIPTYEADRQDMNELLWCERAGNFDVENTPSTNYSLHADGVFRLLRLKLEVPLTISQDINIEIRAFTLDGGRVPFSSLTSDDFIEWVHSNVHGGEDPFARKIYGFHQGWVRYTNESEQTMFYDSDDFIIPGFKVVYNHYPTIESLRRNRFYMTNSVHLGVSTSKFNSGIDLGISTSLLKEFAIKQNVLSFAAGAGIIRQQLVMFNNPVLINFNKYLYNCELLGSYKINLKSGNTFVFASNLHIQMAYRDKKELDYLVMEGERHRSHWNHASSHLYRPLLAHGFIFTHSWTRVSLSVYAREDFLVDNAPDAQTGVELRYSFKSSSEQ